MKVSLNWLNKYVDLSDLSIEQISEALPMLGLEIESVETTGLKSMPKVVVGEILSRQQHPNADKLGVCEVKVSPDAAPIQIVCGATNYKPGDRVPVALPGAALPTPDGGEFQIKVSQLRGVQSNGMMCSARELGLGSDHSGLLILESRPEIGTPINEVFPDSDTVFEIELTANRGDCLSHIGVARELAARFGKKLTKPELKYAPKYSEKPEGGLIDAVELETPNCPLYIASSIKGVKIGPSPDWMRRSLEAAGMRSINNVVDVTNYVMLEYGQPLHAFDARDLRGKKIVVRQAKDGEKIQTLDDKTHTLTSEATLICDAEGPIGLAGVMGGLNSEVKPDTANIVLESAYFNHGNVRATSRKLSINSDAAYRFSRDVDPQGVFDASRRAVDLMLEVAGGSAEEISCVVGKAPRGDRNIDISVEYINDRLGFEVSENEVSEIFKNLGFSVEKNGQGTLSVTVPSFRSDVDRPIDLVEEFIRLYGSDKIPDAPMSANASTRDDDPLFTFFGNAADYLADSGLNECQNYTLRDSSEQEKTSPNTKFLKLSNPLASDQDCLRSTLLTGLLDVVKLNLSNGNCFKGFFENGKIFDSDSAGEILELCSTAFVLAEDCGGRKWAERQKPDFFTVKSAMFDLLAILGVDASRLNFSNLDDPMWESGYAASFGSVKREGFRIKFGAVKVSELRRLGIEKLVWAGELSFRDDVVSRKRKTQKYEPFSQFPAAVRDLSVIVDSSKSAAELCSDISKIAKSKSKGKGFDVESVNLFDVYSGDGVPEGMKSLAFAISFRSPEKTLLTEEVNEVFDAVCAEVGKKHKLRT